MARSWSRIMSSVWKTFPEGRVSGMTSGAAGARGTATAQPRATTPATRKDERIP
jgi:hypothetical protein